MKESVEFYTRILGFRLKYPNQGDTPVVDLINGDTEIQLSSLSGDSVFGTAVNIRVDDVDGLFKAFVQNGLDTSGHEHSPVHQGPIDQTWGTREFYVTDPSGNTLRYQQHK